MKTKNRKTVVKRFKLTAKGKLKHAVGQWNHMRMKKSAKTHLRKSRERVLASSAQEKIMKSYMNK